MPDFIATPDEERQIRACLETFPFRIVYVARKDGEETIVSAVTSMRIPRRLAREGWHVVTVK